MGLFKKDVITPPSIPGTPAEIKNYSITGIQYECRKNPKYNRQEALKQIKIGAPLVLEYFEFENKPAYMVLACKSGLDIGVLSEPTAAKLKEYYPTGIFVGKLTEKRDYSALMELKIYGERMVYSNISRSQVGVIYKAYKEKKIDLTKKNINYIYEIADMEEQPPEITSLLRRAVEKIFDDDYVGANAILKEAFK